VTRGAVLACAFLWACRVAHAPESRDWAYDVEVAGDELRIAARVGTTDASALHVDDDARAFVRDVRVDGERVRYRFELGAAASAAHDDDVAERFGDAIVAPASAWLLRPSGAPRSYRVRVRGAALGGIARGADGAFEAHDASLDDTPYFAFGAWRARDVAVGRARLTIGVTSTLAVDDAAIASIVGDAASALERYLGGFTTPGALVLVAPADGNGVDGKTMGGGGGSVLFRVGRAASAETLRDSWVVTHELIHLSLPSFGPPRRWLEEGLATYVEPIVRARTGAIRAETVWRDLVDGAPKGLPDANDEGLDRATSWGRTYWGGAVFCLVADLEIRKRTGNARSLDDVLRAVVASGGSAAQLWDIERLLSIADVATGTRVVREIYERYALAPGRVDLAAIWRELGVGMVDGAIVFDERAPLAAIRRAITAP
jgi:hypothetical protein